MLPGSISALLALPVQVDQAIDHHTKRNNTLFGKKEKE
jgi:hypothetical protein